MICHVQRLRGRKREGREKGEEDGCRKKRCHGTLRRDGCFLEQSTHHVDKKPSLDHCRKDLKRNVGCWGKALGLSHAIRSRTVSGRLEGFYQDRLLFLSLRQPRGFDMDECLEFAWGQGASCDRIWVSQGDPHFLPVATSTTGS
jgi:hypothetical protein